MTELKPYRSHADRWLRRREIAKAYRDGETTAEIARRFGVSKTLVWMSRREFGVESRGRSTKKCSSRRQAIVRLYQEGMSLRKVAAQSGCSMQNVHRILISEGCPLRPAHYTTGVGTP